MSSERLSYRFGPLERRGLLGPLRFGQTAIFAGALGLAVGLLDLVGGGLGVTLALGLTAAATALVTAPLAGRTLDQWIPVACAFTFRSISGQRRFRIRLPLPSPSGSDLLSRERPASLRDVHLQSLQHGNRRFGALVQRRGRLLTPILACRSLSFALLEPEAQERRLAQWGSVLAHAASTPLQRLQWIERTAPAQGDELAQWLNSARAPYIPPRGTPIVESYLELITSTTQVRHDHEILLAPQFETTRLDGGSAHLAQRISEEITQLAHALEAADISVLGVLTANQIARVLRTAFDPYARSELTLTDTLNSRGPVPDPGQAIPAGTHEAWDHYRCDGACHATFWISGWPATGVSPMFMDALLGTSATVRTVSVIFEPVAPDRSARDARAAVTRDHADAELRRRFGQSESARQRQVQEAAARREAELAAGHGEVRLVGFVTVSGRDEDELRRACAQVHTHAARGRLELRRLYGQQQEAFSFTLPLGRGLR
ncbi:MAG: SCO6880 family protein [Solirubrobacteraceae bacterium]